MAKTKEKTRKLEKCKACGWQWFPRPSTGTPRICPHCKSARWQIGSVGSEQAKKAASNGSAAK